MNSDVDELARAVLKKSLHECSVEELQQIADQHPYFGPIQLLLATKIAALSGDGEDHSAQYEEQVQKASLYFQNRVWLDHLLNNDRDESFVAIQPINTERTTVAEVEEKAEAGEFIVNETEETPVYDGTEDKMNAQATVNTETREMNAESIERALINEPEQEQPGTFDNAGPVQQTNTPTEMASSQTDPGLPNGGLAFEPYHTVDYFASQGIRFKEEEKPKDRLGMQLKSFTEWLKTLKQVSVAEIASRVDSTAEKKVEQMAEFSLAERHVITEAMAEVWKKQGNKAKAEEIYHKLSLLDPSKSSYFAAKIEELKKTN